MAELINTKVGKAVEIPLQATPTAGFRWELLFPTGPVDLVDFVPDDHGEPRTSAFAPRTSGGLTRRFTGVV